MSQESRNAVVRHVGAFLAERGVTSPRCPLCGAEDGWDAWDMQISGAFVPGVSDPDGPHQQPRVDLVCRRCACILSLRASDLGLMTAPPKASDSA